MKENMKENKTENENKEIKKNKKENMTENMRDCAILLFAALFTFLFLIGGKVLERRDEGGRLIFFLFSFF